MNQNNQNNMAEQVETVQAEEVLDSSNIPTEIVAIAKIEESNLPMSRAVQIINEYKFTHILKQIQDYEKELDSIVIEDENDFENMERCGVIRKALVKLRTGSKSTHDDLKDEYKITGKFIDHLHNVVDERETVAEEKARFKETTGDRVRKERKDALINERKAELDQYGYNSAGMDLGNMPDDVFAEKVEEAKLLKQAKDRILKEKEEQEKRDFEEQQRQQQIKELATIRLREVNALGIIYSGEDLGELSEESYAQTKAQLISNRDEQIAENERQQKLKDQQLAQAKKEQEEKDQQLAALKKLNDEAELKLKEQQKQLKEVEKKTISIPTFSGGVVKKKTLPPDLKQSKALRNMIANIERETKKEIGVTDIRLMRVLNLYIDMINEGNKRLINALGEYDRLP